jgi:glycosyltransferase involved in cell wall biosynthesis
MAVRPDVDLKVAYCTLRGAEAAHDSGFATTVKWDVPLLDGYDWMEVPNKGSSGDGFFGLYNPGLWSLIREGRFDAILYYAGYLRASFWISYLASRLSRTAFLFGTDTTTLSPVDSRKWKLWAKRIAWPILYRLADQVIVPSTGTFELMRSLGIPAEHITLTPFVVDNDWWSAHSRKVDRNAVRASWGATPTTKVILFCAKLQPWKRPNDLLKAFASANQPDSLLVFAGEGPLRSQLEDEARSLGIFERVRFLGFVNQSELPAIYSASDLMVLPSDYEPFGVVVNEAMLCGCAVAVSDRVGAARDLVTPVNRSFVFPSGDVAALAQLLRSFVADPALLVEYREAAARRIAAWSPAENVAATVDAVRRGVSRIRRAAIDAPKIADDSPSSV